MQAAPNIIWTIFKPDKHGRYVLIPIICERGRQPRPNPIACVSKELSQLRMPLLSYGLRRMERQLGDHENVLETWL